MRLQVDKSRMERCWTGFCLHLMLVAACAVGLSSCKCDSEGNSSNATSSSDPGDDFNESYARSHPPYQTSLRRIGAANGGVWTGRVEDARIIMKLPSVEEASPPEAYGYTGYVAVLRKNKPPRVFALFKFSVDSSRETFGMYLDSKWKGSGRLSIDVAGTIQGDTLRVAWMLGNEQGIIPSDVVLQRETGSLDEDEKRLRKRLEDTAKLSRQEIAAGR